MNTGTVALGLAMVQAFRVTPFASKKNSWMRYARILNCLQRGQHRPGQFEAGEGGIVTPKEMRLAAYFLDWFCEERGNAGCNDMPAEAAKAAQFTKSEDQDFARQCMDSVSGNWGDEEMEKASLLRLQDT